MASKYINTVEELVEYVADQGYGAAQKRWQLWDRTERVYVDEEAGARWREEYDRMYVDYATWINIPESVLNELEARRPEMKTITEYRLNECGSSRWGYRKTLILSSDLGEMIDNIWTKKEYGYNRRVGNLTISGILKRLGKTDIASIIETKQTEIAEARIEEAKTNMRHRVKLDVENLLKLLHTASKDHAVNSPTSWRTEYALRELLKELNEKDAHNE